MLLPKMGYNIWLMAIFNMFCLKEAAQVYGVDVTNEGMHLASSDCYEKSRFTRVEPTCPKVAQTLYKVDLTRKKVDLTL